MKKFVLSFLLIVIFPIFSFAEYNVFDNFDYYRVTTDYNGSVNNGNSILVYGDAGIIVRSFDGGENWEQINLDDSYRIMSIVNVGNDYFGVFDKKYLIKSSDNGKNWEYFDFGNVHFYKIISYKNNLYCMSNTKIIVCNQSGNKIKEYPINVDTSYYDFTILGDKLYYGSSNVRLTEINLTNDKTKVLHLTDYGVIYNDNLPKYLFADSDKIYFNLKNNLYSFNGEKAKLVFSPIKTGLYQTNNKELFELYNIIFSSANIDSLYFIKINSKGIAKRINVDSNDRYISYLRFKHLDFISRDTIIAVGKNKLIYMSYDRGKHWELKSHYNQDKDWGKMFIIDRKHIFLIGKYVKFIHTTDGGITWLPQKNYMPYFTSEYRFNRIAQFGASFFKNNKFGFGYYDTKIDSDTNFIYTNDGGETVHLKNSNKTIGYWIDGKFNFVSYKNKIIFSLPTSFYDRKFTVIFRLDTNLEPPSHSTIDSAQVLFMDTTTNDELLALVIYHKYPHEIEHNKWSYDSVYLSILSSRDTALTWQKVRDIDLLKYYGNINTITKSQENLFMSFVNNSDTTINIYKVNINDFNMVKVLTKKYLSLALNTPVTVGSKTFLNGIYYGFGNQNTIKYELLENDNIENDPTNWRSVMPKKRYNSLMINSTADSLILLSSYDSLMKSNVIWFAKAKKGTAVEEKIEIFNNSLYLSYPSPNPARNFVRTKIYFNKKLNIKNAEIKVYDILGNLVSQKNEFEINNNNEYSAFIRWRFGDIKNGVYLISVKLGLDTRSIPFIICR